jgi:hypothetical protein
MTDAEMFPEEVAVSQGSRVIVKCLIDPFYYACRLKTGESFRFEHGDINGEFIHFSGVENGEGFPNPLLLLTGHFERGLDVRLDQIAWIADGTS